MVVIVKWTVNKKSAFSNPETKAENDVAAAAATMVENPMDRSIIDRRSVRKYARTPRPTMIKPVSTRATLARI